MFGLWVGEGPAGRQNNLHHIFIETEVLQNQRPKGEANPVSWVILLAKQADDGPRMRHSI